MQLKRGYSLEITEQLTTESAEIIAQWIGGYTVIKNQKTRKARDDFQDYIAQNKAETARPKANAQVAYLNANLPFLKDIPSQIRRNAGAKWLEASRAATVGLRKAPTIRKKHQKRNCYVTNELFDVQVLDENRCLLQLKNNAKKGTKSRIIAGFVLPFAKENVGKALFLSRKGARFHLSISHDKTFDVMSESDIKSHVKTLSDEEITQVIQGFDLGVKRQVTSNTGKVYHLKSEDQSKLKRLEMRRKRYQRKVSKIAQVNDKKQKTKKRKRTHREIKLHHKIARYGEKRANILRNNSHHISKEIAENTPLIAGFEALKINNMVRKPRPKICEKTGKWLKNGRAAKRGLNRAILSVNMGQIRQFSQYKLAERGKLLVTVNPCFSSQECSCCGFISKDNRPEQAVFNCLSCGLKMNADENAANVVKKRTKIKLLTEMFPSGKTVKKTGIRKRKMALEPASLGCGGEVRPDVLAHADETLKTRSTA
jgi:transposase